MLRPDRCEIAKELYWGGGSRPKQSDAFAVELMGALSRDSDVLLDIGAYTGLFSFVATAVNPSIEVHAFEIVSDAAELLRENVKRNDVEDRVIVHLEGIGAPDTSMVVPSGSGGSAIPSFYSSRLHFDDGVLVSFRPLDSLIPLLPEGSRVLVKVDVEGTEVDVFRHGQELLGRFRPTILCEVLPDADGHELSALLDPIGYRFYRVGAGTLIPSSSLIPDAGCRDWLFTTYDANALSRIGLPVRGSGGDSV